MSDHQLPEDMKLWPSTPHAILGVSRDCDEVTLRRAYSQLIRRFKPEIYPEQFRKIREAYDLAKDCVNTGLFQPRELPTEPVSSLQRSFSLEEELTRAWNRAIDGDDSGAYATLKQLQESHPGYHEIDIRLYWLLRLNSKLDPTRSPREFLVRVLRANSSHSVCRELYRREIEANRGEALTDRFEQLLTSTNDLYALSLFAVWRWDSAVLQGRFAVIASDLELLRPRIRIDDDIQWLGLIVAAAKRLAWYPNPKLRESDRLDVWQQEAKRFKHLELTHGYYFDELERLQTEAEEWRKLQMKYWRHSIFRLIPLSQVPFAEVRGTLITNLKEIAENPARWLDQFDEIGRSAPSALYHFDSLLDQYESSIPIEEDEREGSTVHAAACTLLAKYFPHTYLETRHELLIGCLRERVTPKVLAVAAESLWLPRTEIEQIESDLPFLLVYRSYLLYQV